MSKNNFTIAVLGGMGTYATINLFKQYAQIFDAQREDERPRIIIDNRCTMPSRVRAVLYNEKVEELVDQMTESMNMLVSAGGENTHLILACNTSHLFLDRIFQKAPFLKKHTINIIQQCVEKIADDNVEEIYLLASEGTIDSGVYHEYLSAKNIKCIAPDKSEYAKLRTCIEVVKQNKYSAEVEEIFLDLVQRHKSCILGCTELPVLFDMYGHKTKTKVYDPCVTVLKLLKEVYDRE